MQQELRNFIISAKASLLANAKKPVIEPIFSIENSANSIYNHANYIDLTKIQLEQIAIATVQLEKSREHLVGALAVLKGFEGLEKRDLLLSANFVDSYIYMLDEFVRLKQLRSAKPVKGIPQLRVL